MHRTSLSKVPAFLLKDSRDWVAYSFSAFFFFNSRFLFILFHCCSIIYGCNCGSKHMHLLSSHPKNKKKTEFMDEGRVVDVSYLNVRNAVNSLSQYSYIQVGKLWSRWADMTTRWVDNWLTAGLRGQQINLHPDAGHKGVQQKSVMERVPLHIFIR